MLGARLRERALERGQVVTIDIAIGEQRAFHCARPGTSEDAPWMDPAQFWGHGGGCPLAIRGVGVVGTIAVSGLPHEVDHALKVEAPSEHLGV